MADAGGLVGVGPGICVIVKSVSPLIAIVFLSHLSARPSVACGLFLRHFAGYDEGASGERAHYDADSDLDHRAFLSVEPVAHMTDSQRNTDRSMQVAPVLQQVG